MLSKTKITIIGNSVSLRVRPPQKHPNNKNYSTLLQELFLEKEKDILIINKAIGATTVYNIVTKLDEYINTFPEYFIINLGVVDASSREIPLWFFRLANSNRDGFIYLISRMLYRIVLIKIRPLLVRLRFKKSWVSEKKFKKNFKFLIESLLKETNAKIIIIPINKANSRIKKELPGSDKKYERYNKIMQDIAFENACAFINLSELNDKEHFPDGIHFSLEGHKILAKKISKEISL